MKTSMIAAAALVALVTTPALAGDPTGVWLRANGNSKIRIDNCGSALCGTVVWEKNPRKDTENPNPALRDRPITGVRVLLGLKPSDTPDQWKGEVYNADDGKTYTGYITLQSADTLKLQGCVLGGLICKSDTWGRSR